MDIFVFEWLSGEPRRGRRAAEREGRGDGGTAERRRKISRKRHDRRPINEMKSLVCAPDEMMRTTRSTIRRAAVIHQREALDRAI